MKKKSIKSILYIAYFYHPVTGVGIPATQRVTRFLKYLNAEVNHVLTMNQKLYPNYINIDRNLNLPIKNEVIHRAGALDLFKYLIKCKMIMFSRKKAAVINSKNTINNHQIFKQHRRKAFVQELKDLVSLLFKYPDFARPWLFPALLKGINIIRKNKIDIIFATGMPWTSLIVGYFLKFFAHKKLVVDFRDPWVGNPYIDKSKIEKFFDRFFEKYIVKKSDLVIVNTFQLQNEISHRYRNQITNVIMLPNGYDDEDFKNLPLYDLPKDKLIIVHAGYLYLKRDPKPLLEAIFLLKEKKAELAEYIEFHQIGRVDIGYDLKKYCQHKNIAENVKIINQMSHRNCLGYLKSSDVLVVIQTGTKTQIPSKLYEYVNLEKPILTIADKGSALESINEKHSFGHFCNSEDIEGITKTLYILINNRKNRNKKIAYPDKYLFNAKFLSHKLEKEIIRIL